MLAVGELIICVFLEVKHIIHTRHILKVLKGDQHFLFEYSPHKVVNNECTAPDKMLMFFYYLAQLFKNLFNYLEIKAKCKVRRFSIMFISFSDT